jgi:hypothetical protein
MMAAFYWLYSKKPREPEHILPAETLQQYLDGLFEALQTYQHEAFLEVIAWAMTWVFDAKTATARPPLGLDPTQRAQLRKLLADETVNLATRTNAAILLTLQPEGQNVYAQHDWIYTWAQLADGLSPHRQMPEFTAHPDDSIVASLRDLLKSDVPSRNRKWAAVCLGRLGYFDATMVEPLFKSFEDPMRSFTERDEALVYLVMCRTEAVGRRLQQLQRDKATSPDDYDISERALLGLVGLGDVTVLREQLNHGRNESNVLSAYAYALAGVHDQKGREVLEELKDHPDEKVRAAVQKGLRQAKKWGPYKLVPAERSPKGTPESDQ